MRSLPVVFITLTTLLSSQAQPGSIPGHSHNDYEHARPLSLALENRLESVEVDVHLVDERLMVAHDADDIHADRTIESLYLGPLRERWSRGPILPGGAELILLVDFKTEAVATYHALESILPHYDSMLTSFVDNNIRTNAVRVVISGNRPVEEMRRQAVRYAFIDGRPSDLGNGEPSALIPLISDNWNNHFQWKGRGAMSADEKIRLRKLAAETHAEGKWLRLWAAPDTQASWTLQRSAGIDFINTDDPEELRRFFDRSSKE